MLLVAGHMPPMSVGSVVGTYDQNGESDSSSEVMWMAFWAALPQAAADIESRLLDVPVGVP